MRLRAFLIIAVGLLPAAARAQSGTTDGIQAMLRGDYANAIRILRPLAEEDPQPDPLAQFFLAMLYHPGDPIRACGLYIKAATTGNPLMNQSLALAAAIRNDSPVVTRLCSEAAADAGRELPPDGFDRASDRRVTVDHLGPGVDAFVRGDYARAVEIFRPLAENWPLEPDEASSFFMALMYENGLGIPADPVHACALYLRATVGSSSSGVDPIRWRAGELADALHRSITRRQSGECYLLTNAGFDHGFQPASFSLEPGHSIRLELSTEPQGIAATIFFQGKETRVDSGLFGFPAAVRFVSLDHTELTVRRPPGSRRHFIEGFAWVLVGNQRWSLMWQVKEVVRDTLVDVTMENLLTVSGEYPPSTVPIDVREVARLRVNEDGNAEWAVVDGSRSLGAIIETDAEREEAADQSRARKAAAEKVDWDVRRDLHRMPVLRYSDADGCGRLSLYGWSDDRTEAISVAIENDALKSSVAPQLFDIAARQANVVVGVHVFEQPQGSWPFCTDVGTPFVREVWRAIAGTMAVELSAPGIRTVEPQSYRATIRLDNATFVSASGARVTQVQPIMLNAVITSLGVHGP